MVAYAVVRVLIVNSFSTGVAVLGQEVPGLLLIALVVVLIRLRVPRLRHIVDAEQAAMVAKAPGEQGQRRTRRRRARPPSRRR